MSLVPAAQFTAASLFELLTTLRVIVSDAASMSVPFPISQFPALSVMVYHTSDHGLPPLNSDVARATKVENGDTAPASVIGDPVPVCVVVSFAMFNVLAIMAAPFLLR
jgi:hypothetical protein